MRLPPPLKHNDVCFHIASCFSEWRLIGCIKVIVCIFPIATYTPIFRPSPYLSAVITWVYLPELIYTLQLITWPNVHSGTMLTYAIIYMLCKL